MKPYQPSNQVPSTGFTWMIWSSVLGGLAIGGITFAFSLFFYLVFLFPICMGCAGGAVMQKAIRGGKVRNPAIASLFAALTGAIVYSTLFVGEYWLFKEAISEEITQKIGVLERGETDEVIDGYLQENTGSTGLWGFIQYRAKQGISIGEIGREGFPLNETFTWIYWLIEFAVIDGIIITMAYSAAKQPFCDRCEKWYDFPERLGNVPDRSTESFLQLLKNDNFKKAGQLVDPIALIYSPSLEVQLQRCSSCQTSDYVMTVSQASLNSKGQLNLNPILQGTFCDRQHAQLREGINEQLLQNQDADFETISDVVFPAAQQERSTVTASDRFIPHGLPSDREAHLVQQLARERQIKKAYLVQKVVEFLPEKPLYVLGIVRRRPFIESEIDEPKLMNHLATQLELPEQTLIVPLNKNKKLERALQKTAGETIYRR